MTGRKMVRCQFLQQWTASIAVSLVVMVTQFIRVIPWKLRFDPKHIDALIGLPYSITCSAIPGNDTTFNVTSSDLELLLDYKHSEPNIPIDKKHFRIVNASSIQLLYASLPAEFGNRLRPLRYITCRHKRRKKLTVSANAEYIKEPHLTKPRVTLLSVYNWEKLQVGWEPALETDRHFKMKYELWYRNDSSTSVFAKFQNCAEQLCTIAYPFRLTSPGEVLIVKVNGSVEAEYSRGILETVTSEEVMVNLTKYLRPRKIEGIDLIQNKSTKTLVFKPPKTNRNIIYNINVNCNEHSFAQTKNITRFITEPDNTTHTERNFQEPPVTEPLVGLPPYSNCTASLRAISVDGGNWSDWAHYDFQTLQDVPLTAPKSCKGCFQVRETGTDSLFHVIIYFIPLTKEEARGRVELYRIRLIKNGSTENVTELFPELPYFSSFLLPFNLSNENDYEISIEAKTLSGHNETLNLSSTAILVPQSQHRPNSLPHKFSVVVLNETTVRTNWETKERNGTEKIFLFWCKGSVENDRRCRGVMRWKEFPIASTENSINISHVVKLDRDKFVHNFIFGTGIERNGKSSGITWSSCMYDIKSPPPKPRIQSYSAASSGISISLQEPTCPNTGDERGFVIGYRVNLCPIESPETSNDPLCRENMRSIDFSGSQRVLNLNGLKSNQSYLVLIQSISEGRTSKSETRIKTLPGDDSFLLTTIIVVLGAVAATVIVVLIVCYKQGFIRRYFKNFGHVPIIIPPSVVQTKHLPQLVDDNIGYENHLFGTNFPLGRCDESLTSDDTAVTCHTPSSDIFIFQPTVFLSQRSDSGIEVTTPLESILPPLTGIAPPDGLRKQAPPHHLVDSEDGSNWKASSEWSERKQSFPILSVLPPSSTSSDPRWNALDTVSECSGDSRPQFLNDGSGYAFGQQESVMVILPVPSGEARQLTLDSSTIYSSSSPGADQVSSSRSSISSGGLVVYQLDNFNCSTSQAIPIGSEELVRNGGYQPGTDDCTGEDCEPVRNGQPFSDYSSVIFEDSSSLQ